MSRRYAVGDRAVYVGESAPVPVQIVAPAGEVVGACGPLYWVRSAVGAFVVAECWLEGGVR